MTTETCSICKSDYEHTRTYDNGDKLYKCGGGHFMVQSFRKDPEWSDEDLGDFWMGAWQYQWTQQLALNQISWEPVPESEIFYTSSSGKIVKSGHCGTTNIADSAWKLWR